MKYTFTIVFFWVVSSIAFAQNVGIGTSTPDPSAKLDVVDANRGILIPRITLADVTLAAPVTAPAKGLLIYNTNAAVTGGDGTGFYYWNGTQWVSFSTMTGAENGLYVAANNKARLGGPLIENTQINLGAYNLDINLDGLGDFSVQDAGIDHFHISSVGLSYFGDNTYWRDGDALTGTLFAQIYDDGDDGHMILYENGGPQIRLDANGTSIFNEQGLNRDFRVESDLVTSMLHVDASANRVGIGTATPVDRLHVSGGRVEFTNTNDANGAAGTGVLEIGNSLRIDGNEVITNTGSILYLQNDNNGDLRVDGSSLAVDASANAVGVGTALPNANSVMEIRSTTKGMLTPRMTTTQRDAIGTNLAEGLLIYNTTNNCFEFWDTKSTPVTGSNGFWNSLCQWCENVIIINSSTTGFNLNNFIGGAQANHYCVYVRAGVSLQATSNGGSGSAGNPGFNASTMPAGSSITLYNYGNIYAGGGDGGRGGQESDAVCRGDNNGQNGGRGGHAIQTSGNVPIQVLNYGLIRAGGGGGGGGGASCCSAGGGGGGGAGLPAGQGAAGRTTECASGFVCGCGTSNSAGGNGGTALVGGNGGGGVNRGSTGCTCNGTGAGTGGRGGNPGVAGNNGTGTQRRGFGGAAGLAVQGNGSGSSISNFGTQIGGVNP